MKTTTPEANFETARLVAQMVALAEQLLSGRATRGQLQAWAEQFVHEHGYHRFSNPAADGLLSCFRSLDEKRGDGDGLVRPGDLAQHLDDLRMGLPPFDPAPFAALKLTPGELATRTGTPATRFMIDGLGWHEATRFASPVTGRRFVAMMPLTREPRTSVHTHGKPPSAVELPLLLADLFDTLVIDSDELTWTEVAPLAGWRLWRSDDNGNHAVVRDFTGYAKARSELAQYEAKAHKQSYWLEAVGPR